MSIDETVAARLDIECEPDVFPSGTLEGFSFGGLYVLKSLPVKHPCSVKSAVQHFVPPGVLNSQAGRIDIMAEHAACQVKKGLHFSLFFAGGLLFAGSDLLKKGLSWKSRKPPK